MPDLFHHAIHFHHHKDDQFREVFWMRTVRSFGVSFVGIFIPIYIFNVSSSTAEAVLQLTIYAVIMWGLRAVFILPSAKFIAKVGTKHALAASAVFLVLWAVTLTFIDDSFWFLYLAGVTSAFVGSLYFTAFHAHAAVVTNRKRASKQLSGLLIMRRVAMSLGPLVGGVIAESYGIDYALYAGALVALLSILFLDLDHDVFLRKPTLKKAFKSIDKSSAPAFFSLTFQNATVNIFWPLFISFIISGYDGVGLVVTASLVVSIVIMHILGVHGSDDEERKQLKFGTRSLAAVNGGRGAVSSSLAVGGMNVLNDITYSMTIVPFVNQYYAAVRKKKNSLNYVCGMEIIANLGYVAAALTFFILFQLIQNITITLVVLFVIAGLISPLISGIARR